MQLIFINKLTDNNLHFSNIIKNLTDNILQYCEFNSLKSHYDKLLILTHDSLISYIEADRYGDDFVGFKKEATYISENTAAYCNTHNNLGAVILNIPQLIKETPQSISIEDFVEYILHHEICHLMLNEGKTFVPPAELMGVVKKYEKIPERLESGFLTLRTLRGNRQHYLVDRLSIARFASIYLRQKFEALSRYDWEIIDYPRTSHKVGLDYSITLSLSDCIQSIRNILNLKMIKNLTLSEFEIQMKDKILVHYQNTLKNREELINRCHEVDDLEKEFLPDAFEDEIKYYSLINSLWSKVKLTSKQFSPHLLLKKQCGICGKNTRSHHLSYGGFVCHRCWEKFFQ